MRGSGFRVAIVAVIIAVATGSAIAATEKPAVPLTTNAEAQEAYDFGEVAYDKDDYKAATGHYTRAIEQDPAFAEAWYSRGWSQRGTDDEDKAISDFSEAIKLRPGYADAFRGRG
jgi:tetratricopeptide (TPR) repeat protein